MCITISNKVLTVFVNLNLIFLNKIQKKFKEICNSGQKSK